MVSQIIRKLSFTRLLFLVAHTKLTNIFRSSTAHQSVYERMLDRSTDEIKISECAETFLTLIHAMEGTFIFKLDYDQ
jgi:hypothetical protein